MQKPTTEVPTYAYRFYEYIFCFALNRSKESNAAIKDSIRKTEVV